MNLRRMLPILALALVLMHPPVSAAYEIRILPSVNINVDPADQGATLVDDLISFDFFLDTQGLTDISIMAVALEYDSDIFSYRSDLSDMTDIVLYSADVPNGKAPPSTNWLAPELVTIGGEMTFPLDPPQTQGAPEGRGAVQVALLKHHLFVPLTATATDAHIATVTFQRIAEGDYENFEYGFDPVWTVFSLGDFVDIREDVPVTLLQDLPERVQTVIVDPGPPPIDPGPVSSVPEPGAALVFGLGLLVFSLNSSHRRPS